MPSKTTHYKLNIFDREADKTQYFVDFRDALAGTDDSNMILIDKALYEITQDALPYEAVIEGDGLSKHFLIPEFGSHGKGNTFNVSIIDKDTNTPVATSWEAISAGQISVSFKSVLPVNKKYSVLIG